MLTLGDAYAEPITTLVERGGRVGVAEGLGGEVARGEAAGVTVQVSRWCTWTAGSGGSVGHEGARRRLRGADNVAGGAPRPHRHRGGPGRRGGGGEAGCDAFSGRRCTRRLMALAAPAAEEGATPAGEVDGRVKGSAAVRWCERWAAGAAGRGEEEGGRATGLLSLAGLGASRSVT